jgi:mRNA interferase RelE/StbE
MPFKVVLSENAERALRKIDRVAVKRIIKRLKIAANNPNGTRIIENLSGRDDAKLRAGDYRLIVRVLNNEGIIFVIGIGHRRDVYDKN